MKIIEIKRHKSTKSRVCILGKPILTLPVRLKEFKVEIGKEKFGVSYSVFDGEELLEKSIKSIRDEVDYVNVVYQEISWFGNPCDPNLLPLLQDLKEKGLIDELIFFAPDLKKAAGDNEREKRNVGLKAAIKSGVNYFMTMDCDEIYLVDEVKKAKEFILSNQITHSYCTQLNYDNEGKNPIYNNVRCLVQFFCKVDKFSVLGANEFSPCIVDPTRKLLERKKSKHFILSGISMHHFSLVRKCLESKYRNSSCKELNEFGASMKQPETSL